MLEISLPKIAQVIILAHEMEVREDDLRRFIEELNEEEQIDLVSVMWIGRESYSADELDEARETASTEATTPTADYLMGVPHLADHLENGLDALGISVTEAEEDLL